MDFKKIQKKCHNIAKEKGWWDEERNKGELIALIHSELSEALEALREGSRQGPKEMTMWEKDTYADELADVVIRVMDLAEAEEIDLEWQIKKKNEYNKKRKRKHGKKF